MSTLSKKLYNSLLSILALLVLSTWAVSQDIKGNIQLVSSENPRVVINLKIENERIIGNNLSFLKNYADAKNLGSRISNLRLYSDTKEEVPYKKFASGEYVANSKFNRIYYTVDVSALENPIANAHISWVGKTHGLLMLNDLFPKFNGESYSASIAFELPVGWQTKSEVQRVTNNEFLTRKIQRVETRGTTKGGGVDLENFEDSVFLVGRNWREKEIQINMTNLKFFILDKWQFEDELAFEMAEEIIKEYSQLFGEIPVKNAQIVLMNFPKKMERGRWRAETRGANIVILSSQAFAESFAKQRLHEQLRHEIFHLWIPNSLNLSDDYAWFYEGFAIYQALKTGVNLGQIRFEDFLNTLEQAYFLNQKRSNNNSLINLSKMRWNGEVSSVYSKGMLVAFLCDVAILKKSKGKRNVKDLFRILYQKHGKWSKRKDANTSILNILQEVNELESIINLYIKGKERIDWTKYLYAFGIENVGSKVRANLRVKSKLSRRQKALLKKLGYNRRRKNIRQKIIRN